MNPSPNAPPPSSPSPNGNPNSADQSPNPNPNAATGFRFHPTEEELISSYLNRKVSDLQLPADVIAEVDLYKHSPWDLPSLSRLRSRDREWFFFTSVDRKYGGSQRANRVTSKGYWKSTGRDREVRCGAKVIGMKKCLVFHVGRCSNGRRTDWLMHEYRRLDEDEKKTNGTFFVVCRVFNKSGFGQKWDHYGAPFVKDECEEEDEEENNDEEAMTTTTQDMVSSKETKLDELMVANGEQDHVHSNDIEQGTKNKRLDIYCIGSQVEVAYIREMLPVAWYTATVMDIKDERILSVEYLSLRNDDGSLLHEIVSTQYVRPRSPSTLEIRHFELLDEVEAFYNGGWWPGVVAKVHRGLKYNVKFMHLEEEIEFSNKELRLLYDWIDGQWIQLSQDKAFESQKYAGLESDGNMQLWHAGSPDYSCKVPGSFPLSTNYVNDATREFPTSSTNTVNENSGRPLLTCNVSEAPCIIATSSTDDVCVNSNRSPLASMVHEAPRTIPISFTCDVDENSHRPPLTGNVNEAPCTSPIFSTNDVNEGSDRSPLTSNNVNGALCLFPISCTSYVNENSGGSPLTSNVSEAPCIIPISSTKDMDENSDKSLSENYVGEACEFPISSTNYGNQNLDMCLTKNDSGYPVSSTNDVNEARRAFPFSSTSNVNESSERCPTTNCVDDAPCAFLVSSMNHVSENLDGNDVSEGPHELPVSLPVSFINNGNDNSNYLTFQSLLEDLQPCKKAKKGVTTEGNLRLWDSTCAETSSAAKIGFDVRTPIIEEEPNFHIKTLVEKFYSASPFKNINLGSATSPFKNIKFGSADSIAKLPSNILLGEINEKPLIPEKPNQEFIPGLDRQGDKGVRQHTAGEKRRKNCRPQKLMIIEPSLEGDSMRNRRENEVVEPPIDRLYQTQWGTCSDNGSEARALFNVTASSSDFNLVETSTSSVQPSGHRTEAQNEALSFEVVVEKGRLDKSPTGQLPLPFEKCSSMWDSIELAEVFKVMPQRPHFRPLEQYCRELREGMAIGLMVTFSNLVNKINKLDIADSRHKFDRIMKTLVHLEGHGFDVQSVRAHLEKMQRVKDNQERLVSMRSTLERKVKKREREKVRLNVVIESIEKASRGFERSLSHLYIEKSSILKQKTTNDSRLDKLEMDSRRVDDALLTAERDFKATRSAKW